MKKGFAMDCSLTAEEKNRYDAWLHSPSVFSSDPIEMILAFKIARALHLPPTKTLKVLRGMEGQNEEFVRRVEVFVINEPTLVFAQEPPERRIGLVESPSPG